VISLRDRSTQTRDVTTVDSASEVTKQHQPSRRQAHSQMTFDLPPAQEVTSRTELPTSTNFLLDGVYYNDRDHDAETGSGSGSVLCSGCGARLALRRDVTAGRHHVSRELTPSDDVIESRDRLATASRGRVASPPPLHQLATTGDAAAAEVILVAVVLVEGISNNMVVFGDIRYPLNTHA